MRQILGYIVFCGWSVFALSSWGQQTTAAASSRPRLPGGLGSNFIERYVLSPEFRAEHHVSDEQAAKIKSQLDDLEKEVFRIETEVSEYARQQAEIVRRLMSDETASEDELYRIIEKIGTNRMAQAKIAMKRLVVIRNCLTPEQRKHAMIKLVEEYERRQQEKIQAEKPPVVKFPPVLQ